MTIIEIARYMVTRGLAAVFLTPPAAPTVTPHGTIGSTAYSYVVVGRNQLGATTGTAGSTATGVAFLGGSDFNAIVWAQVLGASAYDIYRTVGGATQGLIGSTDAATFTFNDTGLGANGVPPPSTNTAATDIGLGVVPAQPDRCYAVLPYGSSQPSDEQYGTSSIFREYPVIRVVARGLKNNLLDAMSRANAAYLEVGKIGVQKLDNVLYESARCFPPQAPTLDGNNLSVCEFRVRLNKAPSLS